MPGHGDHRSLQAQIAADGTRDSRAVRMRLAEMVQNRVTMRYEYWRTKDGQEELVARTKELAEANERIAQLEKTIKDTQKLVELKSPGMAAAQQKAETAKPAMTKDAKPEPQKAAAKPEKAPLPAGQTMRSPALPLALRLTPRGEGEEGGVHEAASDTSAGTETTASPSTWTVKESWTEGGGDASGTWPLASSSTARSDTAWPESSGSPSAGDTTRARKPHTSTFSSQGADAAARSVSCLASGGGAGRNSTFTEPLGGRRTRPLRITAGWVPRRRPAVRRNRSGAMRGTDFGAIVWQSWDCFSCWSC